VGETGARYLSERPLAHKTQTEHACLGGGERIFRDDGALRPLRLVSGEVTTTGAILATYLPAEA
jgi:hypothetical protein